MYALVRSQRDDRLVAQQGKEPATEGMSLVYGSTVVCFVIARHCPKQGNELIVSSLYFESLHLRKYEDYNVPMIILWFKTTRVLRFVPFSICLMATCVTAADSWPEFRGPTGDGHALGSRIPIRWSEVENVAWKTPLPGRGWSTPVLVGSQLWMTSASEDGHRLFALAVDRQSGKLEHRVPVVRIEAPEPCNALNSYASPSPVADGR